MFQLPGIEVTPIKAKFTPPFLEIYNLSSDDSGLDSVETKEFWSQLFVSTVSLEFEGCCSNSKLTPAKRNVEETMSDGIVVVDGVVKMIKKELE